MVKKNHVHNRPRCGVSIIYHTNVFWHSTSGNWEEWHKRRNSKKLFITHFVSGISSIQESSREAKQKTDLQISSWAWPTFYVLAAPNDSYFNILDTSILMDSIETLLCNREIEVATDSGGITAKPTWSHIFCLVIDQHHGCLLPAGLAFIHESPGNVETVKIAQTGRLICKTGYKTL